MCSNRFRFILFSIFFAHTTSFASAVQVKCPVVQVSQSIFNASRISKNSAVGIEKRDGDYPVSLIMYDKADNGLCNKSEFARYSLEGSIPIVETLFFYKLDGEINLFTIVSWSIDSRGDETYGMLYQVYAYKKSKDGSLRENKLITEDRAMTGIDGYDNGQQSTFPYKTAAGLKRALSRFRSSIDSARIKMRGSRQRGFCPGCTQGCACGVLTVFGLDDKG
jgi:hypothetical protein